MERGGLVPLLVGEPQCVPRYGWMHSAGGERTLVESRRWFLARFHSRAKSRGVRRQRKLAEEVERNVETGVALLDGMNVQERSR